VFSWNQSRHGIPGWFGLGTALDEIVAAEGVERARQLYREWPFFRALINNAQLALARADIEVAEHYSRLASPEARGIFTLIRDEHDRTVSRVLEVVDRQLLLGNRPHLVSAVKRRNPYVDVLSHTQIELLRRLAAAGTDEERDRLRGVLFITINGIAAGLQTAG
jgi:phosphoenolpyruvate carboxylase